MVTHSHIIREGIPSRATYYHTVPLPEPPEAAETQQKIFGHPIN